MKIDKIKKVAIVAFLLCSFSLISCNNEGINIKENVEGIKLNKGAVVENIDGTYKNLNLNDERYEKSHEKYEFMCSRWFRRYDVEKKSIIKFMDFLM